MPIDKDKVAFGIYAGMLTTGLLILVAKVLLNVTNGDWVASAKIVGVFSASTGLIAAAVYRWF